MKPLDYLVAKYALDLGISSPINIPNVGRNSLPEWFHDLDFKVGVEVGVAEGEYSESICKANPQMKIYGIDPYESYKGSQDYIHEDAFEMIYRQAQKRLKHFPEYVFIKELSMEALKKIEDNSLDFVYIDANHTEPYVAQDIEGWSKKVKTGGIVSGHDYVEETTLKLKTGIGIVSGHNYTYVLQEELPREQRVKEAVNTYTRKNDIKPWFVLDVESKYPSWLWIKQ